MPGLRKQAIINRLINILEESRCSIQSADFIGSSKDLPCQLTLRFPNHSQRKYNIYCWTIGHGGRTRSTTEYRIQAKLKEERRLHFKNATTVLLGYYDQDVDKVGKDLGNTPPHDMEVIAAWNPISHLKVGSSSSCQVSFTILREAYWLGASQAKRKCADGLVENVLSFRPEFLARYLYLAADGHEAIAPSTLFSVNF